MRFFGFLLFTILGLNLFSQSDVDESGLPIIENFSSKEYKGHPQNFAITQDKRGVIFIGNANGVLEYDGKRWSLVSLEPSIAYSASYIKDRVWVGIDDDFGFLDAGAKGELNYRSVYQAQADSNENFGPVWKIHNDVNSGKVFFQSDFIIFELDGEEIHEYSSEELITASFLSKGVVYAQIEGVGLTRLMDQKFIPIKGNGLIRSADVRGIVKLSSKKSLLFTANQGMYELDFDPYGYIHKVSESTLRINEFLIEKDIEHVQVIDNKTLAISMYGKGFIVLKNLETITHSINRESGLRDDVIKAFFMDQQDNLWISLENGISKVELNYPITKFDRDLGLEGTVMKTLRFSNKIYAAGFEGIYVLNRKHDEDYNQDRFAFEQFFPEQSWDMSLFESEDTVVVACLNEEVIEFTSDGRVNSILECYPWVAQQSQFHDSILYIGQDPGFALMERKGSSWDLLGELEGIEEPIDQVFEENDRTLWLGTRSYGIYRVKGLKKSSEGLEYEDLTYFSTEAGLPEGEIKALRFKERLIFSTAVGIYTLNEKEEFELDQSFSQRTQESFIYRLALAPDNKLWAIIPSDNETRFGPFVEQEELQLWSTPFNPISSEMIYSIFFDGDSVVWFSGPEGIFRYDASISYDYHQDFSTLIRKVSVNNDSLVFGGNYTETEGQIIATQPELAILEMPHDINSFSFEFAAQAEAAPEKQEYSYYLEGFSTSWSKWKNEAKAVFTNLKPGEYNFQVKAKNIFEHESTIANYRFSIAKPWWETPWYYLGQTLFFIILIVLTISLNRGGGDNKFAEIVALITIITVFEFIIMFIEPMFEKYTGGVPVFQLAMNILLALSLNPAEAFIRRRLAKKKES